MNCSHSPLEFWVLFNQLFSVPLSFSSGTYHIREDGAGFSFYFESIYEPAIVVMVRAILYITLFMGIAIFFLESSSGSIRIDCLEEGGGEWEKIGMVRGSFEIGLKLRLGSRGTGQQ
jgi:hypothetical protein